MEDDKIPDSVLWHQSGVSPAGEPFVQLIRGTEIMCQMSVEQAREHARAIQEAAEAAEQDAFLMYFAQEQIGLDFQEAGRMLMAFREHRAKNTGKSQGPTSAKDWVMPTADKTPGYVDFTKKRPGQQ